MSSPFLYLSRHKLTKRYPQVSWGHAKIWMVIRAGFLCSPSRPVFARLSLLSHAMLTRNAMGAMCLGRQLGLRHWLWQCDLRLDEEPQVPVSPERIQPDSSPVHQKHSTPALKCQRSSGKKVARAFGQVICSASSSGESAGSGCLCCGGGPWEGKSAGWVREGSQGSGDVRQDSWWGLLSVKDRAYTRKDSSLCLIPKHQERARKSIVVAKCYPLVNPPLPPRESVCRPPPQKSPSKSDPHKRRMQPFRRAKVCTCTE